MQKKFKKCRFTGTKCCTSSIILPFITCLFRIVIFIPLLWIASCNDDEKIYTKEDFIGYWTLNDTSTMLPFWYFSDTAVGNGWFGFESSGVYSDWYLDEDSIILTNINIKDFTMRYNFISDDVLRLRYIDNQSEVDYNFFRQ